MTVSANSRRLVAALPPARRPERWGTVTARYDHQEEESE
jgi:hypothetical protein